MSEEIERLPKWAQRRIRLLEQHLEEARARAYALENASADGRIAVSHLNERHWFPGKESVRFFINPLIYILDGVEHHSERRHWIDARITGEEGQYPGDCLLLGSEYGLSAMPASHNALLIKGIYP